MATNQTQPTSIVKKDVKAGEAIRAMIKDVRVVERFKQIVGERANAFLSTVATVSTSPALADADPNSIMSAAVVAACLDLPIDPNLGQAAIVPYSVYDKEKKVSVKMAQFQIMKRGFVQLALRSSQYRTINAMVVYEGQVKKHDLITGDIVLVPERKSDRVIGAVAYIELINGFRKSLYMTKEQLDAHGSKYSKSFNSAYGKWATDRESMYEKTVLKRLLSHYGVLSVQMQQAVKVDQSVVDASEGSNDIADFEVVYPDNPASMHDQEPASSSPARDRQPGEDDEPQLPLR